MAGGPAHFSQMGQFLGYPLKTVDEKISPGLVQRLVRYAVARMVECGFGPLSRETDIEVYTTDANEPPSSRAYAVKFKTAKLGYIELVGILTGHGWPAIDHGFEIGADPR